MARSLQRAPRERKGAVSKQTNSQSGFANEIPGRKPAARRRGMCDGDIGTREEGQKWKDPFLRLPHNSIRRFLRAMYQRWDLPSQGNQATWGSRSVGWSVYRPFYTRTLYGTLGFYSVFCPLSPIILLSLSVCVSRLDWPGSLLLLLRS